MKIITCTFFKNEENFNNDKNVKSLFTIQMVTSYAHSSKIYWEISHLIYFIYRNFEFVIFY